MKDNFFDLTIPQGYKNALTFGVLIFNPFLLIGWKLLNKVISSDAQFNGACKIIEQGRKNDAKKIKLKVSKDVGIKLDGKFKNMPIKILFGSDDFTELEIEYK